MSQDPETSPAKCNPVVLVLYLTSVPNVSYKKVNVKALQMVHLHEMQITLLLITLVFS